MTAHRDIVVTTSKILSGLHDFEMHYMDTEHDLIMEVARIVQQCDPDIMAGMDVQTGSWGYLVERARAVYSINLSLRLSRLCTDSSNEMLENLNLNEWYARKSSALAFPGRHILNIWKILRKSLHLSSYHLENIAQHVLKVPVPYFSVPTLTEWSDTSLVYDMARYYLDRNDIVFRVIDKLGTIAAICEQSRFNGIDFMSVLTRGSQFKVESLLLRIVKFEGFVLISPSRHQITQQKPLEVIPMVMEPKSNYYNSPIIVLDFNSLYPSIMIAFNICYSTFLGQAASLLPEYAMGFKKLNLDEKISKLSEDDLMITPNEMVFVKKHIREGSLGRMLRIILETRYMIKAHMRHIKSNDPDTAMLLNNRQASIKLFAAVVYGYTSASFSGRMPCSEIADSIVSIGRTIMDTAMRYINSHKEWHAEVAYGDTDSLFVHVPNASMSQAFDIGEAIVSEVSALFPPPIRLKLEKVYSKSVLLTKKRYVGYAYETRNQENAIFDAKGMETVRRDGIPAIQKLEKELLLLLFETDDLSKVKEAFQSKCTSIMNGDMLVSDFCFAKEVKLGSYGARTVQNGTYPPGAKIAMERLENDEAYLPHYGERIPYIVTAGPPGTRIADRSYGLPEFLSRPDLICDYDYYLTKVIVPPLDRIFKLIGCDVMEWYQTSARSRPRDVLEVLGRKGNSSTLKAYMKSRVCTMCGSTQVDSSEGKDLPLCAVCLTNKPATAYVLQTQYQQKHMEFLEYAKICTMCCGAARDFSKCLNIDCNVYHHRETTKRIIAGAHDGYTTILSELF
ncbi:hypothetical protein CANCADRAFT_21996 [Tortispora caseinolytica NRRL Y-17796]|uniref:DNA polymerase n=1 Tax=Tortispora caseinolytica NRRL Y-17796 TaxID=767744 RepID=A0A1E4TKE0_9ASCO|nr:hypothetical protein CANCADRAFT_21996 [Tortispora caseinolytica NRRL Y-17796]